MPTWSWMAYDGGIDFLDLPLGGVDWLPPMDAIQSPWASGGTNMWHTGDGKESVELKAWARPFIAGHLNTGLTTTHNEIMIVYDNPGLMMKRSGDPLCVVVGRGKNNNMAEGDILHYVLVITPSQETSNTKSENKMYERVGVGYMQGKFLDFELPAQAVVIC